MSQEKSPASWNHPQELAGPQIVVLMQGRRDASSLPSRPRSKLRSKHRYGEAGGETQVRAREQQQGRAEEDRNQLWTISFAPAPLAACELGSSFPFQIMKKLRGNLLVPILMYYQFVLERRYDQSVKMRHGLTRLPGHRQASCDLAKLPAWPSWTASTEAIRGNSQGKS